MKLRYFEGSDGSEHAAGFYDSQLNVACTFELMSDGNLQCTPIHPYGVAEVSYPPSATGYWGDAACKTTPVAIENYPDAR